MSILLDTHALLWFLNGDDNLSETAKNAITNAKSKRYISIASIWEVAIKTSLNKSCFDMNFKQFLDLIDRNGFEVLQIRSEHAMEITSLEFIHRDPFDRMIIAQSITDRLTIVTKDENIKKYKVKTIW